MRALNELFITMLTSVCICINGCRPINNGFHVALWNLIFLCVFHSMALWGKEQAGLNAFAGTGVALISAKQANTAGVTLSVQELSSYHKAFINQAKEANSIFPQSLREESLSKAVYPKCPTALIIYKSSDQSNQRASSALLNLWLRHKQTSNFILIDTEREINYYAMLFLKDYWKKNQSLRILVFSPNGKQRVDLSDVRDLIRLESELSKIENETRNDRKSI